MSKRQRIHGAVNNNPILDLWASIPLFLTNLPCARRTLLPLFNGNHLFSFKFLQFFIDGDIQGFHQVLRRILFIQRRIQYLV